MTQAPYLTKQFDDIQGMVGSGYGWLKNSRFWLLTIKDGQENAAKAWLASKSGSVATVAHVRESRTTQVNGAIAIAFSYSGLTKLGCTETKEHPFPTPFRSGMGSELRASLLRDKPRDWDWSDVDGTDCGPAHVLIAEWWLKDAEPVISDVDKDVFCALRIDSDSSFFKQKEHDKEEKLYEAFEFRDGLAQPVIRGLREEKGDRLKEVKKDAGAFYDDRVVATGEFILGYRNEYDELTYCPNVVEWPGDATQVGGRFGLNGSYLAVRQIRQDVVAFGEFERKYGEPVCEKLMGRRRNGAPLSWKSTNVPVSDSEADAFRYRVEDANGFICPKGAHIRRVNPRDTLGVDVKSSIKSTKLHRLVRRGRPYRAETDGKTHSGIFFIACNADLERQFEFIHQRWVRNPNFGTVHADDPIVGTDDPASLPKTFSMPGLVSGQEVSLSAFTETLGGGYFFLPGIKALNFIVGKGDRAKVVTDRAKAPAA